MELLIEEINDVAVVVIPTEELEASNVDEFRSAIAPVLRAHGEVILDLSRLRFVDSSGMGAILSCLRQLSAKGGDLKLCGMAKQVRAIFELVRMHRIFDIYPTKREALYAFAH